MNKTFPDAPVLVATLLFLASGVVASSASAAPQDAGATAGPLAAASPPVESDVERRLKALERTNEKLREEVEKLRDDHASLDQRVEKLLPLSGRITGYLDFGFFVVQGDGSGIRNDTSNLRFPEYAGVVPDTWVFMGDPLSPTINSRGDVATTGPSRAVTFDPVHNGGKASFILNTFNMSFFAGLGEDLTLNAAIDFVPRGRDVSNPNGLFVGDYIDVKLGYVEYIAPLRSLKLSLFAGKFDSVLGREYRSQEAPDRLGVSPSLICRYTCGRPLGLKARAELFHDVMTVNLSVTNGSHISEGFPFQNEIDQNFFKTVAGRISARAPLGAGLEVGVSGAFGAQDLQSDDSVHQWHYGVDAHLDWHDVDFSAEFAQGRAVGKTQPGEPPCGLSPCIRYKGAYAQVGYRLFNWLTPYVRADWRDALHESGASFVYVSQVARFTGGLHVEIGTSVVVKAEYTLDRELGRIPEIPDDVFTSSMVVKY